MRGLLLLLGTLFFVASANACSISRVIQKAQSSFQVTVHDPLDRPVPKTSVKLMGYEEKDHKKTLEVFTDFAGVARFESVPSGKWTLSVGHVGFFLSSSADLLIEEGALGTDHFEFTWPDSLYVISLLKGRINFRNMHWANGKFEKQEINISKAHLKLSSWLNGDVVSSTDSDEDGYYAFEKVKPGKYLLQIDYSIANRAQSALVPIEFDPNDWHALDRLDVTLENPICGPYAYLVNS
jgi:hypothetical protein